MRYLYKHTGAAQSSTSKDRCLIGVSLNVSFSPSIGLIFLGTNKNKNDMKQSKQKIRKKRSTSQKKNFEKAWQSVKSAHHQWQRHRIREKRQEAKSVHSGSPSPGVSECSKCPIKIQKEC